MFESVRSQLPTEESWYEYEQIHLAPHISLQAVPKPHLVEVAHSQYTKTHQLNQHLRNLQYTLSG